MTALDARRAPIAGREGADPGSLTEDYVGLARYLAEAIARGEVPLEKATVELAATATGTEQASLQRAAIAAQQRDDCSSAAALLARIRAWNDESRDR
jgi:hypothetical protein